MINANKNQGRKYHIRGLYRPISGNEVWKSLCSTADNATEGQRKKNIYILHHTHEEVGNDSENRNQDKILLMETLDELNDHSHPSVARY